MGQSGLAWVRYAGNRNTMKKYILSLLLSLGVVAGVQNVHAQSEESVASSPDVSQPDPAPEVVPLEAVKTPTEVILESDPVETVEAVISDVRSGDWRHAIAGILVLLMLAFSKWRDKIAYFKGDRGGALSVIGLALAGGVVTALYASMPLDLRLLSGSLGTAASAAGIYTLVKKLIWPSDGDNE